MVYSTCSLNPIENEAVIAELLRTYSKDSELEIVNVENAFENSDIIPHHGLSKWKVMIEDKKDKNKLITIESINDPLYNEFKYLIEPSCFPPTEEEIKKFHLENCVRLLPHDKDTNGFFITVIKKNKPLAINDPRNKNKKIKQKNYSFISENDKNWIKDYYGLDDDFPFNQILTVSESGGPNYSFVSKGVSDYLNSDKNGMLKLVNAGVKLFSKNKRKTNEKDNQCLFRICQDGLMNALPFMHKRVAFTNTECFKQLIAKKDLSTNVLLDENLVSFIENIPTGYIVIVNAKDSNNKVINKENVLDAVCAFSGKNFLNLMIGKEQQQIYFLKYGIDKLEEL